MPPPLRLHRLQATGLYHNTDRSVGWADCTGLHNPRFEPRWLAPRSRLEDGADHSTLTLREVAGRPRITTPSQNHKKARGWHTNREGERAILVSHLATSCRDPKRFGPTVWLHHGRYGILCAGLHVVATRGGHRPTIRIQSVARERLTSAFSNGGRYLTQCVPSKNAVTSL